MLNIARCSLHIIKLGAKQKNIEKKQKKKEKKRTNETFLLLDVLERQNTA